MMFSIVMINFGLLAQMLKEKYTLENNVVRAIEKTGDAYIYEFYKKWGDLRSSQTLRKCLD